MAEYAVFLYSPPEERGAPAGAEPVQPPEAGPSRYDRHSDELASSGAMIAAFALEPAWTATSLRADLVTDGPFIETKEVILGFYVIEAPDLEAALAIARRNPILADGGGLEVRPVAQGRVIGRAGQR